MEQIAIYKNGKAVYIDASAVVSNDPDPVTYLDGDNLVTAEKVFKETTPSFTGASGGAEEYWKKVAPIAIAGAVLAFFFL